ncbi:2-polyprenyl-6-methoxyphenol hydroxylase-like FAD-dependent oxidoreductase [Allocatelliglobosispora scoriae]|uniref:2-polyprenyl-6-methoxyphenol hydroxylase-like FAD-dependent oxidoreductase n=1 Tax=Allocatelliglobosispora scoriae TaxID=643052 RepID=A0A841BLV9_9ACTN|nr:FAD-binding monooxygenase [Allocatelliglobosispora scoriae]MBB5870067.1 2-polyprenyl-6-methoxyphenol hydroxylase-like FAD-dependent oxidoreductase [Allocatelliglobosispora scoriae]
MDKLVGERVVVLGGSVSGMYAAAALSPFYRDVVIIDRDELIGVREARRGAPQARHINGLLAAGARAQEELFPEITAQMITAGCPQTDLSGTVRWYFLGKRAKQVRAGLTNVAARRPIMELHLRERVQALGNVTFMEQFDITGVVSNADKTRITGVKVSKHGDEGASEEIVSADLIVDCTGRGSRSPVWLEELGYERVAEEGTKMGLGYATRHYKLGSVDPFGTDHSIVCVANPVVPRGCIFTKTDGGTVELTTYGILGDHPPVDPEGFNAFVKTLVAPEVHEAIVAAEPLNDVVLFRFPTTMRRRYERLTKLPEGLLIMGDAVCTPNPVFAQAQTLAALQALRLRDALRTGSAPKAVDFAAAVSAVIDPAWEMTESINLSFPDVEGHRSLKLKMLLAYMKRVQMATHHDASITEAFMRSAGLVDPIHALMTPSFMRKVFKNSRPEPESSSLRA